MAICPHCRAQNVEGTVFCGFCGKELAAAPQVGPRCPKCGADRTDYSIYCGSCGAELPPLPKPAKPAVEPVGAAQVTKPVHDVETTVSRLDAGPKPAQTTEPATTSCPNCGAPMSIYETYCYSCHHGTLYHDSGLNEYGASSDGGGLTAAGVLMILVGMIALGTGALYLLVSSAAAETYGSLSIGCCGGLEVIFGLGSLFGGVFAIQRKHFFLALLGAIAGLFTVGPLFLGSILSFVAVILVAMNHQYFRE